MTNMTLELKSININQVNKHQSFNIGLMKVVLSPHVAHVSSLDKSYNIPTFTQTT